MFPGELDHNVPEQKENPFSKKDIVIIDDYVAAFKWVDGFAKFLPHRIIWATAQSPTELTKELAEVERPEDVAIIVADQFYEEKDRELQQMTRSFVETVKAINHSCWVIEQSAAPQEAVYNGTNIVAAKADIEKIIEMTSQAPIGFRQRALEIWSKSAFLASQGPEGYRKGYTFEPEKELVNLMRQPDFVRLLPLLPKEVNFSSSYRNKSKKDQGKLLHLAWEVIGHLSVGANETFYGFQLQRLNEILESGYTDLTTFRQNSLDDAKYLAKHMREGFLEEPESCQAWENLYQGINILISLFPDEISFKGVAVDMFARHLAECPYEQEKNKNFDWLIKKYPKRST